MDFQISSEPGLHMYMNLQILLSSLVWCITNNYFCGLENCTVSGVQIMTVQWCIICQRSWAGSFPSQAVPSLCGLLVFEAPWPRASEPWDRKMLLSFYGSWTPFLWVAQEIPRHCYRKPLGFRDHTAILHIKEISELKYSQKLILWQR